MRTRTFITLAGLLFCVSVMQARDSTLMIKGGVLDLQGYHFKGLGPLELRGEYEFYWNQMLDPAPGGKRGIFHYIDVPGSWYELKEEMPEVERHGFATYRLMIKLPEGINELAFKIDKVYSSSAIFINGKAVDYLGYPGMNRYQTLVRSSRPLVITPVEGQELELLIQVANFESRKSGITGGITMGLPEQMREARQHQLFIGHMLVGAFLIIGFYFLGLFLIRTEHYRLYFAMICFLMAIRVVLVLEFPLLDQLNLSGLALARLEQVNIYLFGPCFNLMVYSLYPHEHPRWIYHMANWIPPLFVIFVLVVPLGLFTYSLPVFFSFFLLFSVSYVYTTVLAWIRGRSHAAAFSLGMLVVFVGATNDLLNDLEVIQTFYMVHLAMFAYLLIYAFIFADKSNVLQRKSDSLMNELNDVRMNLEDLVEERTTELQEVSNQLELQKRKLELSNRDLLEAMNARNRLFSIIGHDVRAPIGYIRQALDMIMENDDMSDEEREDLLRMMASSSEITYNLLDNLLVWGRSQTGKLKSNPVNFALKSLVDESLELVNIGIREKKLKVEVFISEEHQLVADRDQLYVVVRNLLSNAIKFTPDGGSIYISSRMKDGEVVISIRDTGIGIPSAIRSKLLDTHSHVSTDGTQGEKGSGLGLKTCHEIIQTNSGWMKIESAPGNGTTILVGLPAEKQKKES